MRKLFASVVCIFMAGCAVPSKAQVFVMPNQGGGEITLTSRPCVINGKTIEGVKEAYTWSNSTAYAKACWAVVDGAVHVLYLDSNKRMVYPIEDFRQKQ